MKSTSHGIGIDINAAAVRRGEVFRERFKNQAEVEKNGGTLYNDPTFSDGLVLDGVNQYAVIGSWINVKLSSNTISFIIDFTPHYDADAGVARCLFDAGTPNDNYFVANTVLNTLRVDLGDTTVFDIANVDFANSWLPNQRNKLIISGDSGVLNNVWLNGNLIATNAVSWTKKEINEIYLGALDNPTWYFDGVLHEFRIIDNALTADEATAYYNGTMLDYDKDAEIVLPMLLRDHDATNEVTIDRSGKGHDCSLGDSAVSSATVPVFDKGEYTFDIFRFMGVTANMTLESFSLFYYMKLDTVLGSQPDSAPRLFNAKAGANDAIDVFFLKSNERIYIYLKDSGGSAFVSVNSANIAAYLNDLQWHSFAVVFDRDANKIYLYVDGVLIDTIAAPAGTIDPDIDYVNAVCRINDGIEGKFSAAHVSSRALNHTQIIDLHLRAEKNYHEGRCGA